MKKQIIKWTQQEIDYLKENYGKILVVEIAKKLNKTVISIYYKAKMYNLSSALNKKGNNINFLINWNRHKIGKTNKEIYGIEKAKQIGEKLSRNHRKFNTPEQIEKTKRVWDNEDFRNKTIKNMLKNKKIFPREQILFDIIKRNNLPFNYVGNGQIVMNGFCPDFLSKNPKHIIELYGDRHYNKESKARDKKRIKAYSSFGYKTLIINNWDLDKEEKIVNKIKEFIKQ